MSQKSEISLQYIKYYSILSHLRTCNEITESDRSRFHQTIDECDFSEIEKIKFHQGIDFIINVTISNTRKLTDEEKSIFPKYLTTINIPNELIQKLSTALCENQ